MPPAPQFKIEEVWEACLTAMADLLVDLPSEIGSRLKLQRVAQRHYQQNYPGSRVLGSHPAK
jgi:hypothetical protein